MATSFSTFGIQRNVAMRIAQRVTNMITAGGTDVIANSLDPDKLNVDDLRRALYNNAFKILFKRGSEQILTPDFTTRQMISKLKRNIFPLGTRFDIMGDDDKRSYTIALQRLLSSMRWQNKLRQVVKESSLMGYSALRSTYNNQTNKWVTVVKAKEDLILEPDPTDPDRFYAVSIVWHEETKKLGEVLWHKERWTDETYERWQPIKGTDLAIPDFTDKPKINDEINNYGMIPVTIIPHETVPNLVGMGVIRHDDIQAVKCIIRLLNKRHNAHLRFMGPTLLRINHQDTDEPVNLSPDSVIDLVDGGDNKKVDAKLLESQGVPDSARQEMLDWADALYTNNGLTPPSQTKEFMAGGVVKSGVALKVLNEGEVDTIEDLRKDGYCEVGRHVEKLLLMSKNLGGKAWAPFEGLNLDGETNDDGMLINIVYPPIFSPSDEERLSRVTLLERSNLPNDEKAKREAEIFGIDDEDIIKEIELRLDEKDKAVEPTNPNAIKVR